MFRAKHNVFWTGLWPAADTRRALADFDARPVNFARRKLLSPEAPRSKELQCTCSRATFDRRRSPLGPRQNAFPRSAITLRANESRPCCRKPLVCILANLPALPSRLRLRSDCSRRYSASERPTTLVSCYVPRDSTTPHLNAMRVSRLRRCSLSPQMVRFTKTSIRTAYEAPARRVRLVLLTRAEARS